MCESLKSNTTLTELNLSGEHKRKKTHKRHPSTIHSSFFISSTGNKVGDTGAKSLSDALKSNTTLTELDLNSGYNGKEDTQKPSINKSFFPFHFVNRQRHWRHRSNVIE